MTFNMRVLTIMLLSSISLLLAINGGLSISGYTANSVILKLWNASFTPVTGTTDYQIKVIVNYSLANSSLVGQKINSVMKVHGASGDVVKTSSFPNGFSANNNGTTQLLTNIPKLLSGDLTTEVYFTTMNKSSVISNTITTLPHFENITTIESLPTITNIT
jgi:hypothetical protein